MRLWFQSRTGNDSEKTEQHVTDFGDNQTWQQMAKAGTPRRMARRNSLRSMFHKTKTVRQGSAAMAGRLWFKPQFNLISNIWSCECFNMVISTPNFPF